MKKTYISPNMEIIKLQTQKILASSIGINKTGISEKDELLAPGFGFRNWQGFN